MNEFEGEIQARVDFASGVLILDLSGLAERQHVETEAFLMTRGAERRRYPNGSLPQKVVGSALLCGGWVTVRVGSLYLMTPLHPETPGIRDVKQAVLRMDSGSDATAQVVALLTYETEQ